MGTPFLRLTREGPFGVCTLDRPEAVVSERATFRGPELYRGIADTHYSQMLARLIGPVRTRDLMFTGRILTAEGDAGLGHGHPGGAA